MLEQCGDQSPRGRRHPPRRRHLVTAHGGVGAAVRVQRDEGVGRKAGRDRGWQQRNLDPGCLENFRRGLGHQAVQFRFGDAGGVGAGGTAQAAQLVGQLCGIEMADLDADPPRRTGAGYRDRRGGFQGGFRGRGTVPDRGRIVPGQGRQHRASEQAHRGHGAGDDGDHDGKVAGETALAAAGLSVVGPSLGGTRLSHRGRGAAVPVHASKYTHWNDARRAGMLGRCMQS